jgi:hypothetical protein
MMHWKSAKSVIHANVLLLAILPVFVCEGQMRQTQRKTVGHQPSRSEEMTTSLKRFLRNYLSDPKTGEDKTTRVAIADVQLRDRGDRQIIAYITGREWCGSGGCVTIILEPAGADYRVITEMTITRPPIRVLKTKCHGWHDISVRVQGGGIVSSYEAKLSFDGETYPMNPTVVPAQRISGKLAGTVAISRDDSGVALFD